MRINKKIVLIKKIRLITLAFIYFESTKNFLYIENLTFPEKLVGSFLRYTIFLIFASNKRCPFPVDTGEKQGTPTCYTNTKKQIYF